MKFLTLKDSQYIYQWLLNKAERHIERSEYADAHKELEYASRWAYTFNFDFSTTEIDRLIHSVRMHYIDDFCVEETVSHNIVMLDSFAYDNRGLTQQYIRAFKELGYHLLFINTDAYEEWQHDTRKELSEYTNAKALYLDNKTGHKEKLELIREEIKNFKPSKMFLHFAPWDFLPIMAADACKGVDVYNINLTDHAFWPGASFIDYDIEFRQYGRTIDIEKRGFKEAQLLNLPYYPIEPKEYKFEGFPTMPDDAVIIFTGGSYYKMFGAEDMFFKMLESLLGISEKVHVLIAGDGDRPMMETKIGRIKGKERIFLLGNRHDIGEVFKHCDIYLGTYPFLGGLMTQYAVYYEKPLLILENPAHPVHEVVNHFGGNIEEYKDLPSLINYARKLITDVEFRISEGSRNKASMMDKHRFVTILQDYLNGNNNELFSHWKRTKISYKDIPAEALERENHYGSPMTIGLWNRYRWQMFTLFPKCFPLTISVTFNRIATKIRRISL